LLVVRESYVAVPGSVAIQKEDALGREMTVLIDNSNEVTIRPFDDETSAGLELSAEAAQADQLVYY
jgi:hypothetical protein